MSSIIISISDIAIKILGKGGRICIIEIHNCQVWLFFLYWQSENAVIIGVRNGRVWRIVMISAIICSGPLYLLSDFHISHKINVPRFFCKFISTINITILLIHHLISTTVICICCSVNYIARIQPKWSFITEN
jgi:hypothetical protein